MRLHKKGQSVYLTLYIKQFLLLLFVLLYLGKENGNLTCIFTQFVYKFNNLSLCHQAIQIADFFFMHLINIQYSKFSSSEPLAKVLSPLQFTSRSCLILFWLSLSTS